MPRTRAVLNDLDRALLSATLMEAQALHEATAKILAREVRKHVEQAVAARRAQERLTAAETRAERLAWDGECRRQAERRSRDFAAA
jgi:hypothetical protein